MGDFQGRKTTVNGVPGYTNGYDFYFITPMENIEEIYFEQKIVSDFIASNNIGNIASPIANQSQQLSTRYEQQDYVVMHTQLKKQQEIRTHPEALAYFHHIGSAYPYDPPHISSYGQWRTLWENKIDVFEKYYQQQYQERPVSRYQRLLIDTFPYIIGLSENAIQYLQESEQDWRFHEYDRACITFARYTDQIQQSVIWSNQFVYDHPTRDIAEVVRGYLLEEGGQGISKASKFLAEYDRVRSLSIFSWRLLYARLLYPVHLFDFIENGMVSKNHELLYNDYHVLLERQAAYENQLKIFYKEVNIDAVAASIPQLDW